MNGKSKKLLHFVTFLLIHLCKIFSLEPDRRSFSCIALRLWLRLRLHQNDAAPAPQHCSPLYSTSSLPVLYHPSYSFSLLPVYPSRQSLLLIPPFSYSLLIHSAHHAPPSSLFPIPMLKITGLGLGPLIHHRPHSLLTSL
jgi:hypothetical protein